MRPGRDKTARSFAARAFFFLKIRGNGASHKLFIIKYSKKAKNNEKSD